MILYRLREWSLKGDQRKLLMYHGFTTLVKKGVQANISMSKNIVVFSDGTAKEGGQGPNTNVYKLFNLIEDRTVDQVAFYDRGLGTGWRKISGSAFGVGISKNIQECYEFIFENYQSGDQIYLFGFSRGAFTVRSLSGFLDLFGILPKSRRELIDDAYDIYRIRDQHKRGAEAKEFLSRHHTMRCEIKFLGVWDTVGALGLPVPIGFMDGWGPFKHEFHNTALADNVKHGCHALSIDEKRAAFRPTFWKENALVEQVWFPGVHSDVGGGYPEHDLSDITLEWMVKKAKADGLKIYHNHKVTVDPNADGVLHDSRSGIARLFRKKQRTIDSECGKPKVHQSVLDRANNASFNYNPWILNLDHDVEPWC